MEQSPETHKLEALMQFQELEKLRAARVSQQLHLQKLEAHYQLEARALRLSRALEFSKRVKADNALRATAIQVESPCKLLLAKQDIDIRRPPTQVLVVKEKGTQRHARPTPEDTATNDQHEQGLLAGFEEHQQADDVLHELHEDPATAVATLNNWLPSPARCSAEDVTEGWEDINMRAQVFAQFPALPSISDSQVAPRPLTSELDPNQQAPCPLDAAPATTSYLPAQVEPCEQAASVGLQAEASTSSQPAVITDPSIPAARAAMSTAPPSARPSVLGPSTITPPSLLNSTPSAAVLARQRMMRYAVAHPDAGQQQDAAIEPGSALPPGAAATQSPTPPQPLAAAVAWGATAPVSALQPPPLLHVPPPSWPPALGAVVPGLYGSPSSHFSPHPPEPNMPPGPKVVRASVSLAAAAAANDADAAPAVDMSPGAAITVGPRTSAGGASTASQGAAAAGGGGSKVRPPWQDVGAIVRQSTSKLPAKHLHVDLSDTALLTKLAIKVEQMHVKLPALCSCGNASPFDPQYAYKCCANCPICNQPAIHERLLNSVLIAYGLI